MSRTVKQVEWFGNMTIDDVSAKLGELSADMRQQTRLISKLFEKGEEREGRTNAFYQEFREHANEEDKRLDVLEAKLQAEEEKRRYWADLRKKGAMVSIAILLTGFFTFMGSAILAEMKQVIVGK